MGKRCYSEATLRSCVRVGRKSEIEGIRRKRHSEGDWKDIPDHSQRTSIMLER